MTLVIKLSKQNEMFIPADLMTALNLREGDRVKAVVEGKTLRLARLNRFLELRGALSDDTDFDNAMDLIDRAWQTWTLPLSV